MYGVKIIGPIFAGISVSLLAQGNEINTSLTYILTAVAGVIVLMLAILLIALAMIAYKITKQHQGIKGIYSSVLMILFPRTGQTFKLSCITTYIIFN